MKKVILVIGLVIANMGIVSSSFAAMKIPEKKQKNPGINVAEMDIPSKKQKNPGIVLS